MSQNKSVEEVVEEARLAFYKRHAKQQYPKTMITILDSYDVEFKQAIQQERQTSQEREREIVETVLPYLKSFLNTLDSDWSVNPVQATTLEYRIPESVLRDRANEIEAKRERAKQLRQLIENFTNPNKD